jgi:hypothetical protein
MSLALPGISMAGLGGVGAMGAGAGGAAAGAGALFGGPIGWGLLGAGALGTLLAPNKDAQMKQWLKHMQKIGGAGNIAGQTDQLYRMFAKSPMALQAGRGIALGEGAMRRGLDRGFAARGLSGSGMGIMSSPMAAMSATNARTGLNAQMFSLAQQAAMQSIMSQLGQAGGMLQQPSLQQQLLGALIGAGGGGLSDWLKGRH